MVRTALASHSPSTGSPSTGSPSTGSPSTGSPSTGSPSTGSPSIGSLRPRSLSGSPQHRPHRATRGHKRLRCRNRRHHKSIVRRVTQPAGPQESTVQSTVGTVLVREILTQIVPQGIEIVSMDCNKEASVSAGSHPIAARQNVYCGDIGHIGKLAGSRELGRRRCPLLPVSSACRFERLSGSSAVPSSCSLIASEYRPLPLHQVPILAHVHVRGGRVQNFVNGVKTASTSSCAIFTSA